MAVKIRLTRLGKKKQPTYRVVVMDSRKPRDGKYIVFSSRRPQEWLPLLQVQGTETEARSGETR